MNSKHLILSTLMAACVSQTAIAVPAYPRPMKVTQADGTTITVLLRGDERSHVTLTEDGYPLIYNEQTRNYEYATLQQNQAVGSGIVAQAPAERSATAKAFLQRLNQEAVREAATVRTPLATTTTAGPRRSPQRVLINNFPHTGEQHTLVMLIQFSDEQFTVVGDDAKAFYEGELNTEGFTHANGANGSARDYFIKSSCGAFQPTFDVVGPVTVSGTRRKYGQSQGMSTTGDNAGTLLKEAVELIDDEIDFSQYDHDGDGYVDNIYFYYAGYGYADSQKASTIWPHAYSLPEWGIDCTTNDGVKIGSYTCSNEIDGQRVGLPTGIGTFVHEFGHCLGLGDHYDSNNNGGTQNYNVGDWDVMASGNYNNNSNTPPTYSAFERGELGWLDYTELSTKTDSMVTVPELSESNMAYIVRVPDTPNEYFLLENRQQKGWDEYLPGHGMLVWHVDMDENVWDQNIINIDKDHQHVDIVEADGRAYYSPYASASFPGSKGITQFTFNSWDGSELFSLEEVTEADDIVKFLLGGNVIELDSPAPVTFSDVADSTFTAWWTEVSKAANYIVTVTDQNGNVHPDYNAVHWPYNNMAMSNLSPETTYTVSVKAALGNNRSEEATATVTTTAIPFSKLTANPLTASDITDHSFHATWSAVRDAQAYEVTLSKHTYAADTTMQGYDFAEGVDGLPASWETNTHTTQSSSGYYGEAAPSLRFNTDKMYLKIAYPECQLSNLTFWTRGSQGSITSNLSIDRYADGQWLNVDTVACSNTAATLSYDFEPSDSVRITFNKKSGYTTFDDIYVACHRLVRTPLPAYNAQNVGDVLAADFTGLESDATYGLTVRGVQNGEQSAQSAELVVNTMTAATAISTAEAATDATTVYDLQGRRMTEGQLPAGIYIVRQNGKTHKVTKQ